MNSQSVAQAWEKRVIRPQWENFQDSGLESSCRSSLINNVGTSERLASLAGGAAAILAGRQKGSVSGLLLGLLGLGLIYRGVTGHCHGYQKLGISTAHRSRNSALPAKQGINVKKQLTVNRPAPDLYNFWRDLSNLPRVFKHLISVERQGGNVSHWKANGPMGRPVEWDAEILNDHENELIAWRSLPGSQIETAGSVRFEPTNNNRGTVVAVSMKYNPPGGQVTDYIASWFGKGLADRLDDDLRNFKSYMEAKEVPSTQGQPQGAH